MKQKYQFVSAASAVICGLSLLAAPANASISHVSSPHVSVTHTTPHVSSPHPSAPHFVTHSAGRMHIHHEPKVTKPAKSIDHRITNSAKSKPSAKTANSIKKSFSSSTAKSLNLAMKSQRRQLRLIRSAKHFSKKQTSRVFAANQVAPAYQTAYRHQSVISNPWFWLFMINHHRLSQQTQTDKHYLQGYRYGVKMGQKDLKKHSRYHQNLTSEQEKQHSTKWQKGYYHGYNDAVTDNQKLHHPMKVATNLK